jgi:hypothetical protein
MSKDELLQLLYSQRESIQLISPNGGRQDLSVGDIGDASRYSVSQLQGFTLAYASVLYEHADELVASRLLKES